MQRDLITAFLVVLFGAAGTYLLLPHRHGSRTPRKVHLVGAGLAGLGLLLFGLFWTAPGPWISRIFFYAFAFAAVGGGVLTITSVDPIHSALWFAAVVLATAGLFLLAGASFLAAGTVIVYAGAIIVTFLFVIMLAQMEGRASYDRASRSPFRATWTCFVLLLGIIWSLLHIDGPSRAALAQPGAPIAASIDARLPRTGELTAWVKPGSGGLVADVINRAVRPTARLVDDHGLPKPHVAGLGETLYTDHIATVELTGTLLFAALISALAIATPKAPIRPGQKKTPPGEATTGSAEVVGTVGV